jgi:hypothetical protein
MQEYRLRQFNHGKVLRATFNQKDIGRPAGTARLEHQRLARDAVALPLAQLATCC